MRRWGSETNNRKRERPDCRPRRGYVTGLRLAFSSPVALFLMVLILLNNVMCARAAFAQPSADASNIVDTKPVGVQYFDIPSQPLEDALYAFDTATGIEVFVDGNSVVGRRSATVNGLSTPVDALRAMLAGTGLRAETIGSRAITLAEEPQDTAGSLAYRSYSALVQSAVVRVLCAEPDIRPGSYRIAAQLWLASTGTVSAANLLSSTGNPERDRRIRGILAGISVGKSPPPTLPQPIIMVILPRLTAESGDCS